MSQRRTKNFKTSVRSMARRMSTYIVAPPSPDLDRLNAIHEYANYCKEYNW